MLRDNSGFTLLEMLLVLSIVSMICYVFMVNLSVMINSSKLSSDIQTFTNVVDQSKYCAISSGEKSSIVMKSNSYTFNCQDYRKVYYLEDETTISSNFPSDTISFTKKGTINRAGTVVFRRSDITKELVMTLGRSTYYVKE